MYVRSGITVQNVFWDSWRVVLISAVWAVMLVYLREIQGYTFLAVPTLPVTTIGVMVSFYLGFKNNSAYDRWWEARKIWGAIVNDSRTWANHALNLVSPSGEAGDPTAGILVHRHLAWVNALAYQLRKTSRLKEGTHRRSFDHRLAEASNLPTASPVCYERHLPEWEAEEIRPLANPATHIVRKQGAHLQELLRQDRLDNNRMVEMMQVLGRLYDSQGKCERIKNTVFPWQVTFFGRLFTWVFILLLPLALVDTFEKEIEVQDLGGLLAHEYVFTMVPFSVLIAWLFFIFEKVGESCEDPFEGGTTDTPVTALTRTIEIDLQQMLGEPDIPERITPIDGVLY